MLGDKEGAVSRKPWPQRQFRASGKTAIAERLHGEIKLDLIIIIIVSKMRRIMTWCL